MSESIIRPDPSPRSRDSLLAAQALNGDASVFFKYDPNTFDMLLYRARLDDLENTAEGDDEVGSIEDDIRAVTYEPPVLTRGYRLPLEGMPIVDYFGLDQGLSAESMSFLVEASPVPHQSILHYTEYTGLGIDDLRDIYVFVISSQPLAQSPAMGFVHICIPLENAEALKRVREI